MGVAIGIDPDTGTTVTGVTYGGQAMTRLTTVHTGGSTAGYIELWYKIAPLSGSNAVQITWTGGALNELGSGAVSFTGVDQTTGLNNTATASGSGATAATNVSSAAGNMVYAVAGNGASITLIAGPAVQRWVENVDAGTGCGNSMGATSDGAASVSMSFTVTSDIWAVIGANILAAADAVVNAFQVGGVGAHLRARTKMVGILMAISHVKSNAIGDFTGTVTVLNSLGLPTTAAATDLVRPSDWNSVHNQFYTLSGNTSNASTASGTNVVLQAAGNITLVGSTDTIVISGGPVIGGWEPIPMGNNSTFSSQGQNSLYLQKLNPDEAYSFNNFELSVSGSFVSSSNSQVVAHTIRYGLYSLETNNSYISLATSSLFINASLQQHYSDGVHC